MANSMQNQASSLKKDRKRRRTGEQTCVLFQWESGGHPSRQAEEKWLCRPSPIGQSCAFLFSYPEAFSGRSLKCLPPPEWMISKSVFKPGSWHCYLRSTKTCLGCWPYFPVCLLYTYVSSQLLIVLPFHFLKGPYLSDKLYVFPHKLWKTKEH